MTDAEKIKKLDDENLRLHRELAEWKLKASQFENQLDSANRIKESYSKELSKVK